MDVPEIDPNFLPERRELIRRFSNGIGPTVRYPNVIHAIADYTKQDRAKEAAKWRPHFQDPSILRYVHIDSSVELVLAKFKSLVVAI